MSQQIKRINPFWITHPMVPTGVAIGGILGIIGYATQRWNMGIIGAVIAGVAVILAARPVVSALLGTLGLFGGLVTFWLVPNPNTVGMSGFMKGVSTLLFAVFYMALMDGMVLVIAALYNLFAGALGMGGLGLDLVEVADDEETAA